MALKCSSQGQTFRHDSVLSCLLASLKWTVALIVVEQGLLVLVLLKLTDSTIRIGARL